MNTKKYIKELGIYGIIARALQEHGAAKLERIIYGDNGGSIKAVDNSPRITALSMFVGSRLHKNHIIKEIAKLSGDILED